MALLTRSRTGWYLLQSLLVLMCGAAQAAAMEERAASPKADQLPEVSRGMSLSDYLAAEPSEQASDRRTEFYQKDRDSDGWLTNDEQHSADDPVGSPVYASFCQYDVDQNQRLSLSEYVDSAPAEYKGAAQVEFRACDLDGDQELEFDEFCETPRPAFAAEIRFRRRDRNRDGQLSTQEYLRTIARANWPIERESFFRRDRDSNQTLNEEELALPPNLAMVSLRNAYFARDIDDDGRMTRQEYWSPFVGGQWDAAARHEAELFDRDGDGFLSMIEFAMAPREHTYAGEVYNLLDSDGDGFLSRPEYLAPRPEADLVPARRVFASLDTDNDRRLTLAELATPPSPDVRRIHSEYYCRDVDDDGCLSLEEYWKPIVGTQWEQAARQEATYWDLNRDGQLSLLEFAMTPQIQPVPDDAFGLFDRNADGRLTPAEFLSPRPRSDRGFGGAMFYRADINRDGILSVEEFRRRDEPGVMRPDAVLEELERELAKVEAACTTAASSEGAALAADEWPAQVIVQTVLSLPLLEFRNWDQDGDGLVTPAERRTTLLIAHGVTRFDGTTMRQPGGLVLPESYYRNLDKDGDDRISFRELTSGDPAQAANRDRHAEWDRNGDRHLTYDELVAVPQLLVSVLWEFSDLDSNTDGSLSTSELVARGRSYQAFMAPRLVAAFDRDGDSALSVDEYQMTPFAQFAADWYVPQGDTDQDGVLSWQEYYTDRPPRAAAVFWRFFRAFDRDGNLFLSPSEYRYPLDPEVAPAQFAFESLDRDQDGMLELTDVLEGTRPPPNEPVQRLRWEERSAVLEDALRSADVDSDGALSVDEFTKHQRTVAATILGRPIGRPASASTTATMRRFKETGPSSGRLILLVTCNVVLLAGAAWMVLRR